MIEIATVTSILAAGGFGGIVVSSIAGGRERRHLRAKVLEAIQSVEAARWDGRDSERDNIAKEQSALHSVALAARIPRHLTAQYTALAQAAAWQYSSELEEGVPDFAAGPSRDLSQALDHASTTLIGYLWAPRLARLRNFRRVRELRRLVAAAREEKKGWASHQQVKDAGL